MTTKKSDINLKFGDLLNKIQSSQDALLPQINKVLEETRTLNTPLRTKDVEINDVNVSISTHANNKVIILFHNQEVMNRYFDKVPTVSNERLVRECNEANQNGKSIGWKLCNEEWLSKPWYKRLFTKWQ